MSKKSSPRGRGASPIPPGAFILLNLKFRYEVQQVIRSTAGFVWYWDPGRPLTRSTRKRVDQVVFWATNKSRVDELHEKLMRSRDTCQKEQAEATTRRIARDINLIVLAESPL